MQNTIRYALFLLIVSGTLFVGCDSEVVDPEMELPTNEEVEEETGIDTDLDGDTETEVDVDAPSSSGFDNKPTDTGEESSVYEDGTYTASGDYASPAGPESIAVTLTVTDDIVSSVNITQNATHETSIKFQGLFTAGISGQVVGKPLADIGNYSSVNGSSLTPNAFDIALASIKAEAAL